MGSHQHLRLAGHLLERHRSCYGHLQMIDKRHFTRITTMQNDNPLWHKLHNVQDYCILNAYNLYIQLRAARQTENYK